MNILIVLCLFVPFCLGQYRSNYERGSEYRGLNADYSIRQTRQQHQQPEQQIAYQPLSRAPSQIQHLLQQQQAREPLVTIPYQQSSGHQQQQQQQQYARPQYAQPHAQPQPQARPQPQIVGYKPQVQYGSAPSQPNYGNVKTDIALPTQPKYNSQQPNYQQQYQPHQQQNQQQPNYRALYKPISGPQQEPQPQYSKNLPPALQQLLQQHRP